MKHKQLYRVDGYGRTAIAVNPSPALVARFLLLAALYGYAIELEDWDADPRTRGAV